jgi:hypothetical protein
MAGMPLKGRVKLPQSLPFSLFLPHCHEVKASLQGTSIMIYSLTKVKNIRPTHQSLKTLNYEIK